MSILPLKRDVLDFGKTILPFLYAMDFPRPIKIGFSFFLAFEMSFLPCPFVDGGWNEADLLVGSI